MVQRCVKKMSKLPARIIINPEIIERVYLDVKNNPTVEIGGRWFVRYIQKGKNPS